MAYYGDDHPFGDDPREEAIGELLEYFEAREQRAEAEAERAERKQIDDGFAELEKRYPQLRDKGFVTEVAERARSLAAAGGQVTPGLFEELTKATIAERTPHRESEWWAGVKAHNTDAFGDDGEAFDGGPEATYEKRRAAELERIEKGRREGEWEPTKPPKPREDDDAHWQRIAGANGDPFASAKPDPQAATREAVREGMLEALREVEGETSEVGP